MKKRKSKNNYSKINIILLIFFLLNILILVQNVFFSRLHQKIYMSFPTESVPCRKNGVQGSCVTYPYTEREKKFYDNNVDKYLYISRGLLIGEIVFCIYSCIRKKSFKLCILEITMILFCIFIFTTIGLYYGMMR